jgi:hypothetical protein
MGTNAVKYDEILKLSQVMRRKLTVDLNITKNDINILNKLAEQSLEHSSGGSYNMLAKWVKGGKSHVGINKLTRRASTIDENYPDACGVHAELDLFYRMPPIKGGTVYIAGTRARTRTRMPNTSPCIYCKTLLAEAYVRYVVFFQNNKPMKLPLLKWHNY